MTEIPTSYPQLNSTGPVYLLEKPIIRNILIICFTTVFVPCVLGNILVIYVVAANRSMRTITNFFLANLAVGDLLVGICCIIPELIYWVSPSWFLGEAICKIYYFMRGTTTVVSISLLTLISVERYIAIILPMHSRSILTLMRMRIAIVMVWTVGIAYNSPNLHVYHIVGILNEEKNETDLYCTSKFEMHGSMRIYSIVSMCLWYFAPLLIMLVVYSLIARRLWISSGKGHMALSETSNLRNKNKKKKVTVNQPEKERMLGPKNIQCPKVVCKPVIARVKTQRDTSDVSASDVSSVTSEEDNKGETSAVQKNIRKVTVRTPDMKKDDNDRSLGTVCEQQVGKSSDVSKTKAGKVLIFEQSISDTGRETKSPQTDTLHGAKSVNTLNTENCFLDVPGNIHRKSKSTSHINENGTCHSLSLAEEERSNKTSKDKFLNCNKSTTSNHKLYQMLPLKDSHELESETKNEGKESDEPVWVPRVRIEENVDRQCQILDTCAQLQSDDNKMDAKDKNTSTKRPKYKRHLRFFARRFNANKGPISIKVETRRKRFSTCSTSSKDSVNIRGVQTTRAQQNLKRTKSVNERVLKARKKVIRLLVAVVGSFALCLLPFQILTLLNFFKISTAGTMFGQLYMPIAAICYFSNSALNPLLYAFLSDNFRMKMKNALMCRNQRNIASRRNLNRPKWQKVEQLQRSDV
ncbi:uncharacterized protein LOC144445795 [Glandiceps talaboti]